MFCVTTLLTSCLAYRKDSRTPTGYTLASGGPEASKSSGKALQKDRWDRNYLLSTEPDPQCEEGPLQVSPVQVATPVGIKKHKSQKAVQGEHS